MTTPAISPHPVLQPDLPEGATVKIIGGGGSGSFLIGPAAIFMASLGRDLRLGIIDGDSFEEKNASRMMFRECGNKAGVLCRELRPYFEHTRLMLFAIEEYVTPGNVARLIHPGDIILSAVDNHATRKLLNDHCATLDDICLISGGNDGIEEGKEGRPRRGTFGNVQIFWRRDGRDHTPPITRFHPEIENPADQSPAEASCTDLAASVPQILFANHTVATAMLNSLYLVCCGHLPYPELIFDIAEGRMEPQTYGMGPTPPLTPE
ncbi:MAG: hypothetical protein HKN82_12275 [Akkermansiaceae bacterium]|nr:hypothetical protein [Akkermansiaceae bacterium]